MGLGIFDYQSRRRPRIRPIGPTGSPIYPRTRTITAARCPAVGQGALPFTESPHHARCGRSDDRLPDLLAELAWSLRVGKQPGHFDYQ
jgi:hypothetical protein